MNAHVLDLLYPFPPPTSLVAGISTGPITPDFISWLHPGSHLLLPSVPFQKEISFTVCLARP